MNMKKAAQVISTLFHPLVMPTLGLLLLLNSGTYLSLLDPAAKKAILFVMALGTLIFPLIMVPVLYYRNLIANVGATSSREERLIPLLIIMILYVITFVYFVRLPLNRVIHAYIFSVVIAFGAGILINLRFRICFHATALGGLAGLIIALIFLYESNMEGILIIALVAGGITGSARLATGAHRPLEVYVGYLLGLAVVLVTLLVY